MKLQMTAKKTTSYAMKTAMLQTKMLPYGIYVVHQIKGLENTEQMEDFEVNNQRKRKRIFLFAQ